MTDEQIKYMRDRFLSWTLPDNLNPDGGITFKRSESAIKYNHPMPVGTNFLDAEQVEAMVRHMVDGVPCPAPMTREKAEEIALTLLHKFHAEMDKWDHDPDAPKPTNLQMRIADALQSVAGSEDTALRKAAEELANWAEALFVSPLVEARRREVLARVRAAIAQEKTR